MGITVQAATNVLALGGEDEMVGSNDIPPAAGQLQVDLRRLEWAQELSQDTLAAITRNRRVGRVPCRRDGDSNDNQCSRRTPEHDAEQAGS